MKNENENLNLSFHKEKVIYCKSDRNLNEYSKSNLNSKSTTYCSNNNFRTNSSKNNNTYKTSINNNSNNITRKTTQNDVNTTKLIKVNLRRRNNNNSKNFIFRNNTCNNKFNTNNCSTNKSIKGIYFVKNKSSKINSCNSFQRKIVSKDINKKATKKFSSFINTIQLKNNTTYRNNNIFDKTRNPLDISKFIAYDYSFNNIMYKKPSIRNLKSSIYNKAINNINISDKQKRENKKNDKKLIKDNIASILKKDAISKSVTRLYKKKIELKCKSNYGKIKVNSMIIKTNRQIINNKNKYINNFCKVNDNQKHNYSNTNIELNYLKNNKFKKHNDEFNKYKNNEINDKKNTKLIEKARIKKDYLINNFKSSLINAKFIEKLKENKKVKFENKSNKDSISKKNNGNNNLKASNNNKCVIVNNKKFNIDNIHITNEQKENNKDDDLNQTILSSQSNNSIHLKTESKLNSISKSNKITNSLLNSISKTSIVDMSFIENINKNKETFEKIKNNCKIPLLIEEDYQIIKQIGKGSFGVIYSVKEKKSKNDNGKINMNNKLKSVENNSEDNDKNIENSDINIDNNSSSDFEDEKNIDNEKDYMNEYALKKIVCYSIEEVEKTVNKCELIYNLNDNENIIKIYKINIKSLDDTVYSISMLMEKGINDLDNEINLRKKNNNYFSEKEIIDILKDIICALEYMQIKFIAHRDIKPENILVFKSKNDKKTYKLCDFGGIKNIGYDGCKNLYDMVCNSVNNTFKGSEMYMSPKLFKGLMLNDNTIAHDIFKSDIYSLGLCIVYVMTMNMDVVQKMRYVENSDEMKEIIKEYNDKNEIKYSKNLINIVNNMLEIDEDKRCDYNQIKKLLK